MYLMNFNLKNKYIDHSLPMLSVPNKMQASSYNFLTVSNSKSDVSDSIAIITKYNL